MRTIGVVTVIPIIIMSLMLYYFPFSKTTLNTLVAFLALSLIQLVINREFRRRFSMDYEKAPEAYRK